MHFEVYPDIGGKYRWRAKAANGQITASSAESFTSKGNAKQAIYDFTESVVMLAGTVYLKESVDIRDEKKIN